MIQVNASVRNSTHGSAWGEKGPVMLGTAGSRPLSVVIAVACLAIVPIVAFADPVPNDIAAGQKLADQICSNCHVIAATSKPAWTDPPPFAVIANRPATTNADLIAHIQKQHANMPATARPAAEANAIAAYILSLRKG
jgi:mono/diheme cytochrome c family protein